MPSKCLLIKWTVSLHYLISTALVWLISLGESPPFVMANTLLSWNLSFSVTEFTSNWVQCQFGGRRWPCSGAGERRRGSARDWQHGWVGDEVAPERVVGWRGSPPRTVCPCVWDTRSGRMLSRPRGRLHERPINGPRMRPKIFWSRTKLKGIPFCFSIFKIWHWNTVSNKIFLILKFLWQFGDKF